MRTICLALALCLLATPLCSQTRAQLKKELKTREAASADADTMLDLAEWAKEKGLLTDNKRLLKQVLKLDPDHEGAMHALGYVRFEGKWMEKAKANILMRKQQEAAYKAKGMKKVDGVWVDKAEVEDAKKGIFHHDGEEVSREDKTAFSAGKVRHPETADFIDAIDLQKAEQGLFPVDDGRWVGGQEADDYHADSRRPWVLRTYYATVITTLPLKKFEEVKGVVDGTIDSLRPLFGGRLPHPEHRPVVVVCPSSDEYRQLGEAIGGATSSGYGAFVAEGEAPWEQINLTSAPVVANFGEEGWGPYYVRHATGLAYARALTDQVEAELPYWLVCGVASLGERHLTAAAHFGEQHVRKGGVKDLEDWFADFEISAQVPKERCEYNVFQSGLVLSYGMYGGDKKATEALQALTAAFGKNGKAVEKAAQKFERLMMGKEEELRTYLQAVIRKG